MKKIKVCHFASVHTTNDTRVFHRECVSLAAHFDVTYIGIGQESGIFKGVKVIAISKPQSRFHRLLFVTWKVFYLALKERAQIYHIHDAELIPFAFLLTLIGKKVIYDIHENTYEDILHKPWIPNSLRSLYGASYRLLEYIASQSMYIILVIAKQNFKNKFKAKKYSIIQNFADLELMSPFINKSRNELKEINLFYMGMITDYYYDLMPVIKAIYQLKKEGTTVNLHCVGYLGNYFNSTILKDSIFQSVQNQIFFYGYQSIEEGYALSKICKIGLCLKNQPEEILVSHERKFFEYMAIGLPVISCNASIYKDIIETHNLGLTVDLTNSQSIANGITNLVGMDLNTMAQNAITLSKSTYNWETESKKLSELYFNLLK